MHHKGLPALTYKSLQMGVINPINNNSLNYKTGDKTHQVSIFPQVSVFNHSLDPLRPGEQLEGINVNI